MKVSKKLKPVILICLLFFLLAVSLFWKNRLAINNQNNCQKMDTNGKLTCWYDLITSTIEQKGIDAAFDQMAALYDTQPEFARNCHAYAHKIGETAYFRFSKNENFKITPKASYCNFGFYHGFMTTLLAKTKDLNLARKFCTYVDNQLGKVSKDAIFQCFHGIGHGLVGTDDTRLWGNEQAMINPALDLCEKVAVNKDQLYRCTSGVFNGIANFYLKGDYKLSIKKDDPLWVCKLQPDKYQAACYGNMTPVIYDLTGHNLLKAAGYIEDITDEAVAKSTMMYLADDHGRFSVDRQVDYQAVISDCKKLAQRIQWPCIEGFARGLIEQGKPNREYIVAFSFCSSPALDSEDKNRCFKQVLSYFSNQYPKEKLDQICNFASEKYGYACTT